MLLEKRDQEHVFLNMKFILQTHLIFYKLIEIQVKTATFQILSSSSFASHPIIRRYIVPVLKALLNNIRRKQVLGKIYDAFFSLNNSV
jgi:hypothetical protein